MVRKIKRFSRILAFSVAGLMLTLPLSVLASGDGGGFGKRGGEYFLLKETMQYSVISYRSGYQRMLLSVNFQMENAEKAIWIFPIPSRPDEIDSSLIDGAPRLYGSNISKETENTMKDVPTHLIAGFLGMPFLYVGTLGFGGSAGAGYGPDVHMHLEKYGLTAELVSADSGQELFDYIHRKNITVSNESVPILDRYSKDGYSFVLTWISGDSVSAKTPGVIVNFPTERLYYPMVLTSLYGDITIPTRMFVIGHVTLQMPEKWRGLVSISYFHEGGHSEGYYGGYHEGYVNSPEYREYLNTTFKNWNGDFTTIYMLIPSKMLSEDLWFDFGKPFPVHYSLFILKLFDEPGVCFVIPLILVLVSFITSFIGGAIFCGNDDEKKRLYIYLSPLMMFGILIYLAITAAVLVHRGDDRIDNRFIASFIPIFVGILALFVIILFLPCALLT